MTPRAYYNERDAFAAEWLRELIRDGLIMDGDVDTRSICDVLPTDFVGYFRLHFFAGIGGWDCALRRAGWPADREIWTGSCPCQPFSVAGQGAGEDDERHLWPAFLRLISECRPANVVGEQVAGAAGRLWLTRVRADLERVGYAVGAADLCAASIGAPHIRQRLYWMADAKSHRWGQTGCDNPSNRETHQNQSRNRTSNAGEILWRDSTAILCRDGKRRRVPSEPAFFPLVDGFSPGRVGILRGAGNAIVPPLAAEFVAAYMEIQQSNLGEVADGTDCD